MKVVISGGGTAGHIYPALSIADVITNNFKDSEILFIGNEGGLENKLVGECGYRMENIKIRGLVRSLSPKNIATVFMTLRAIGKAKKIMSDFKPDIVIGTGGYVCFPVLYAAEKLKIKTAVHESNAVPGLAVKLVSKKADLIMLNFDESKKYFPRSKNVVHTGNPLRSGFGACDRVTTRRRLGIPPDSFVILSFGGSLGASKINYTMLGVMKRYSDTTDCVYHVHACGSRDFPVMRTEYERTTHKNTRLFEYISDMPSYMSCADILICRSGAMTVSEAAACGRATIFIPSPNVTNDHQTKNAKALADKGAAVMIPESELNEKRIISEIEKIRLSPSLKKSMEEKISDFSVKNSSKTILHAISDTLKSDKADKQ